MSENWDLGHASYQTTRRSFLQLATGISIVALLGFVVGSPEDQTSPDKHPYAIEPGYVIVNGWLLHSSDLIG